MLSEPLRMPATFPVTAMWTGPHVALTQGLRPAWLEHCVFIWLPLLSDANSVSMSYL